MRSLAPALLPLAFLLPATASAYCITNHLKEREVRIEQEEHKDPDRRGRELSKTLAPGEKVCCKVKDLDCNPTRRVDGYVELTVRVVGEPVYECGYPPGKEPGATITGASQVGIYPNPKYPNGSSIPFVLRYWAQDGKDLTGPRGLACPAAKKTEEKKP